MVPLLERVIAWELDGADPPLRGKDGRLRGGRRGAWAGEGLERHLLPGLTERQRAHYVSRAFQRRAKRIAGDDRLHAHALRHSFITYLARRGVPEHVMGALAGHDLGAHNVTQRYIAVHGP